MKKQFLTLLAFEIVAAMVLGGCSPPITSPAPTATPTAKPTSTLTQTISNLPKVANIATAAKGSTNNIIGSGLAKVISAHTPITVTDRPFAGVAAFIPALGRGEYDMGISVSAEPYFAYNGMEPYKEKLKKLRLISIGTTLSSRYVTRMDSGIKTLADAKGKKFIWDTTNQSTAALHRYSLEAWGLNPDKDIIKVVVSGTTEQVQALMEGRADLVGASVGMPAILEAQAKLGGIYSVGAVDSADGTKAKYIRERAPWFTFQFMKAGSAQDITNDTYVSINSWYVSTYEGFNADAVYAITKAIWENEAELVAISSAFRGWQKAMVDENAIAPYHEGAIKFYKEVGAWNSKMDEVQRKLLSQ